MAFLSSASIVHRMCSSISGSAGSLYCVIRCKLVLTLSCIFFISQTSGAVAKASRAGRTVRLVTDSSRDTSTFLIGCFRPRILTLALLERPELSSMLPDKRYCVPTVWLPLRSLPLSDMRSRSRIPSCLMLRFSVKWSLFHSMRGAPSKFLQALQCWRERITRGFDKNAWCAVSRPDARSSW